MTILQPLIITDIIFQRDALLCAFGSVSTSKTPSSHKCMSGMTPSMPDGCKYIPQISVFWHQPIVAHQYPYT